MRPLIQNEKRDQKLVNASKKKKKKKVTREVVTGCRSRKVCYHLIPCIIFVHGFFSGTPSLKEKMSGK